MFKVILKKPCATEQCLMDRHFCQELCKYNGGKRIPRTRSGIPHRQENIGGTVILTAFGWMTRPGKIRTWG